MRGETTFISEIMQGLQFQSTPLMRGETLPSSSDSLPPQFQSTPLMRGETMASPIAHLMPSDFNPLPSCEGRHSHIASRAKCFSFQSTPLMRGETPERLGITHERWISIHSPHARGDTWKEGRTMKQTHFNPLPSCEGRHEPDKTKIKEALFQFTPLMRGETNGYAEHVCNFYFNPLPSCEGRLSRL